MPGLELPDKFNWLKGINKLAIGRSPINSSELTAKNMNLNGLQVEYNKGVYLGLSIGAIDYRFRDLGFYRNLNKQYPFLLGKIGWGDISKSAFILTYFTGQKALPAISSPGNAIRLSGLSLEGRLRLLPMVLLTGEVAQSAGPNYLTNPVIDQTKIGAKGQQNLAWAIKLSARFPLLQANFEGAYKRTGSNYQSFSNWQSNTATQYWLAKWTQTFFDRAIKLSASIRSNENYNSIIPQAYKANTIFKSITATFHKPKWPTISLGYIPFSQLTLVNQQVVENRFQTLMVSGAYGYKIGVAPTTSQIFYYQYLNKQDTVYAFHGAKNIGWSQTTYFSLITSVLNVSYSRNTQYRLTIFDHKMLIPLFNKRLTAGLGVKLSSYNLEDMRVGGGLSFAYNFPNNDQFSFSMERAHLPLLSNGLMRNDMGNIMYFHNFSFKKYPSKIRSYE
jgi:hypothetical protein